MNLRRDRGGGINPSAAAHYIDHPVAFVEDAIFSVANKSRPPSKQLKIDKQQKEFLNSVAQYSCVGCKSGHTTGKSTSLSWLILWFLFSRPTNAPVHVGVTAPTYHQLQDVLWSDCAFWLAQSALAPLIQWTSDKIYLKVASQTNWAVPRTTARGQAENLQGLHAPHFLMIVDEGFAIEDQKVWEVIESLLRLDQDNKLVFVGNPTRISGYCYDAFKRQTPRWKEPTGCLLTMNAEKSSISDPNYRKNIAERWGKNSDIYRARVLGEFPLGNPEAFISLTQAEAARSRNVKPEGQIEMGVDVARMGNDLTVLTVRQGKRVFPQIIKEKALHTENARLIVKTAREFRAKLQYDGIIRVKIDHTGEGSGVTDMLVDSEEFRDDKIEVVPIDFRSKAFQRNKDGKFYADITSYMWGQLKNHIDEIEIPDDQNLIDEIATRRFRADKGVVTIERKADFKKDYGASPDRSDSLVLCFADGVEEARVVRGMGSFNENLGADFENAWDDVSNGVKVHYAAVAQQRDTSLCHVFGMWDWTECKLYVYEDFMTRNPVPSDIAPHINRVTRSDLFSLEKFIADDEMWSEDPIEKTLAKQYRKAGMRVHRPYKFDEYGAVSLLNKFFGGGMVVIHQKCTQLITQLANWSMDKGKPAKEGFGMCYALLMLVSECERRMRTQQKLTPWHPYIKTRNDDRKPWQVPGMI